VPKEHKNYITKKNKNNNNNKEKLHQQNLEEFMCAKNIEELHN
jgi:hypothetical protein